MRIGVVVALSRLLVPAFGSFRPVQPFTCGLSKIKHFRFTSTGELFTPVIMTEIHVKCRDPNEYIYKDQDKVKKIKRHFVPAGQISWDVPFDHYDPMTFDAPHLATAPYADPDIADTYFHPNFNQIGKIKIKLN